MLLKKLFGNQPPPDTYSLVDDFAARIRDGRFDLKSGDASGWYDWQTWALETLVVPERAIEASHLKLKGTSNGHCDERHP